MLVLTRDLQQKVRIGSDIIITVLSIDRGTVRLGFEAPPDVAILRSELLQRKFSGNQFSEDHAVPPHSE